MNEDDQVSPLNHPPTETQPPVAPAPTTAFDFNGVLGDTPDAKQIADKLNSVGLATDVGAKVAEAMKSIFDKSPLEKKQEQSEPLPTYRDFETQTKMKVGENQYNAVISNASRFIHSRENKDEILESMKKSGMDRNWAMLSLFAEFGNTHSEGTLIGGTAKKPPDESMESIAATIQAKQSDPKFLEAINNPSHPQYKSSVHEWASLQKKLATLVNAK